MTNYITQEGLNEFKKELEERLETRKEIARSIKSAKEQGDLSENAEYSAAKGEQAENERRINWLKGIIKKSKVAEKACKEKVEVGCFVELGKEKTGAINKFQVVGTHETNPAAGKISYESPIGRALMGKTVGNKIEVETPMGKDEYLIKSIS